MLFLEWRKSKALKSSSENRVGGAAAQSLLAGIHVGTAILEDSWAISHTQAKFCPVTLPRSDVP